MTAETSQGTSSDTLVSVIIPTFNGGRFIRQAVESVLRQTHRTLEVLVVDDGSTDDSVAIVSSIDDDRLSILTKVNGGVASARNFGLRQATGEFVAFLDQDDLWVDHKLEQQLPLLAQEGVGAVGSFMTYLGDAGPIRAVSGEVADNQQSRIAGARLMPFAPSSLVARTQLIRTLGGFDAALVHEVGPIDDLDLLSRIAANYRILTVPKTLGYYRVHADAGSFQHFYAMQRGTRFLQDRVAARALGDDLTYARWSERTQDGLRTRRLERARFLYRIAGFRLANRQRLRGAWALSCALGLAPAYVLRRLRQQVARGD